MEVYYYVNVVQIINKNVFKSNGFDDYVDFSHANLTVVEKASDHKN